MSPAEQSPEARFRTAVEQKLAVGERLSADDGVGLLRSDDLSWLGGLAHRRRGAAAGDRASFLIGTAAAAEGCDLVTVTGDLATLRYGAGDDPAGTVAALVALRDRVDAGDPVTSLLLVRRTTDDDQPSPSPAESMKLAAVCRLLLDNLADIGCDLASHSAPAAALLLQFGVTDLLVPAGELDADDVAVLIWDTGFTPVHRDADFEPIRDYGPAQPQAERRADPQSVFS
ncbi:MAG: hypothetical protein WCA46_01140 [Actinocatenispora sp.]